MLVKWKIDDKTVPVIADFLWTLKFIFLSSHGKMFLVLFQAIIYIFSFKKVQKGLYIICSEERTVFRERGSRKTVGYLVLAWEREECSLLMGVSSYYPYMRFSLLEPITN